MLFNSFNFAIFLLVVSTIYWSLGHKSFKIQNCLLLISSYFFYACWDWRFLFLLIFSTFLDYFTGIKMHDAKHDWARKTWFWISIGVNLGFLATFKYFNFFSQSFADLMQQLGLKINPLSLNIILPVGISFYTFHGLSYVIDIYKRKISPERNVIDYSVFVSFFPLLVAGPIERATHLLPQIQKPRIFNYEQAKDGMRQILWGLFKKMVIADLCAEQVNWIFQNQATLPASSLAIGAVLFSFQIYGDFSGYSDIALGTARLFGIELLKNFSFPYFSRDIAEFWRRWHISLSTWFRDYLYIPLGGSKGNIWIKIRNTFIIFLVSGFWHGANWTFIFWGLLNALFILPSIIFKKNRINIEIVAKGKMVPSLKDFAQVLLTFGLTTLAWVFFRSKDMTSAFQYLKVLFSQSIVTKPSLNVAMSGFLFLLFLIMSFLLIEWRGREKDYALKDLELGWSKFVRWMFYGLLISLILILMKEDGSDFIYFQF